MTTIKKIARGLTPKCLHLSIFFPNYLRRLVLRKTNLRIYAGPFQGLQYIPDNFGSVLEAKLLGIYERELLPVMHQILATPFDHVVDIGAAEGYYAVGLAKYHPSGPSITAFEYAETARQSLKRLAQLNSVEDRIEILGECKKDSLKDVMQIDRSTLVVCDAEGAEEEILNPATTPQLRMSSILVELHRSPVPHIEHLLRDRFGNSHEISEIHQEDRSTNDFPFRTLITRICPEAYILNIVSEFRQPWEARMTWLWMTPKKAKSSLAIR